MAKHVLRTGKRVRPKTAVKGKRYRCAICGKRSPKPVKAPAPWYCPDCLTRKDHPVASESEEPCRS
jgi:rubrerythrin